MSGLENVGIRKFRDHATRYLAGKAPVAISRHGRVIGFYIPVARDEDEVKRAIVQLGDAVGRVLAETGMTEDELASAFDLRSRSPE